MRSASLGRISSVVLLSLGLVGCASTNPATEKEQLVLPRSVLYQEQPQRAARPDSEPEKAQRNFSETRISSMASLQRGTPLLSEVPNFASSTPIKVAAEQLAVPQLAQYVFGELLGLSYVMSSEVERMREQVALNLQEEIAPKELFEISRQLFSSNNVDVYTKDNIVYLNRSTGRSGDRAVGIGRELEDMPAFGDQIVQLVPYVYNSSNSIINVLSRLSNVQVVPENNNRLLILEGGRSDIERALQIIAMMDVPHARGRDIRMLSLVYMSPQQLMTQLQELMTAEGITLNQDVSLVALPRLNSVVVYASNATLGNRISMWASKLDVPTGGEQSRFYVYRPQFAKAADLLDSVGPLLAGLVQAEGNQQQANPERNRLQINADESQNAVIIQASPSRYHEILTLLEQLDRMPGQIAMQVVIAEVTLNNSEQFGVNWQYNSRGIRADAGNPASGAAPRMLTGTLAGAGSIALEGVSGNWSGDFNASITNTSVKVLSRPYLVVRDGESATISSGDQVPVRVESVSSETNPGVVRESVQYRSTGINLSVTPTINADGLISLEISQESSGVSPTGGAALAPVITNRSMTTSALVLNGQTIVLGGLIQEKQSKADNKVPILGSIPLLGNLFKSKNDGNDRTELIMMITPRIIRESSEMDEFSRKLTELMSIPLAPTN